MLGKKILLIILIVLTFLSPVVAINIDLEITNPDYQIMRNNKILFEALNNMQRSYFEDKDIKIEDLHQTTTLKQINMECNSVHTSKFRLNAQDKKDLNILILAKPEFGKFKINSDGTFTYIPYVDYCGMDSFCYVETINNEYKTTKIQFNVR